MIFGRERGLTWSCLFPPPFKFVENPIVMVAVESWKNSGISGSEMVKIPLFNEMNLGLFGLGEPELGWLSPLDIPASRGCEEVPMPGASLRARLHLEFLIFISKSNTDLFYQYISIHINAFG